MHEAASQIQAATKNLKPVGLVCVKFLMWFHNYK